MDGLGGKRRSLPWVNHLALPLRKVFPAEGKDKGTTPSFSFGVSILRNAPNFFSKKNALFAGKGRDH